MLFTVRISQFWCYDHQGPVNLHRHTTTVLQNNSPTLQNSSPAHYFASGFFGPYQAVLHFNCCGFAELRLLFMGSFNTITIPVTKVTLALLLYPSRQNTTYIPVTYRTESSDVSRKNQSRGKK